MKNLTILLILTLAPFWMTAQKLEVEGKAKITDMDKVNTADSVVVRLADGTLGVRDVSTLPDMQQLSVSGDTIFIGGGNFIVLPGLRNISLLTLTVQSRLDLGQTPLEIFNSGIPLDSLYGKTHAGGLIFYLDTQDTVPGLTGLVAAPSDQSAGTPWGCYLTDLPIPNVTTGPSGAGAEIGDGATNTVGIDTAACSVAGDAAVICAGLMLNASDDWYLPSAKELNQMYLTIGNGAPAPNTNIGGFAEAFYWSSSEFDSLVALMQNSVSGSQHFADKLNDFRVRAVRAF